MDSETKREEIKSSWLDKLVPVIILLIAFPVSMIMWLGNMAFMHLKPGSGNESIPPTRWLAATLIPLMFAAWGLKKRSINKSGAVTGLIVGFFLTLSSYIFLACLMTFFVSSSKVTKFRSRQKAKFEQDFKEGGERNWVQVLCNGGMATLLSILYLIDTGSGERTVDFLHDFRSSWLSIGVLAAFACANGDTWASELGTVLSSSDPILITTGRKVPKGVNGGVSLIGVLVSILGGAVVGLGFYVMLIYTVDPNSLQIAPPQWPVIPLAAFAGFIGSFIDSVLGATLQFSGVEKKTGIIVEVPGKGVVHISGRRVLDNHSVNILSIILTSLIVPRMANYMWI